MEKVYYWSFLGKALQAKTDGKLEPLIPEIWKAVRYSRRNNENHLLCQFLSLIHYYYLTIMQDEKEALKIKKELESTRTLRDFEERTQEEYRQLTFHLKRTRNPSKEVRKELTEYCNEFEHLTKLNNAKISLYLFPMLIKRASINREYDKAVNYCQQAIAFFENRPEKKTQHFYSMMIPLLFVQKKQHGLIPQLAQLKEKIVGKDYNLSIIIFYQTLNYIHLQEYQKAYKLLMEADQKRQIDKALKEQWTVLKGFIQVLSNSNRLSNCKRFRISKIINEIPIFNRDKYGQFVNILILKIVIGIQENRDKLIDEKESIEKAYQRYCTKGSREQLLLRILLRFPVFQFDYDKITKASQADIEKLESMSMESENPDIIPFKDILEIAFREIHQPAFY